MQIKECKSPKHSVLTLLYDPDKPRQFIPYPVARCAIAMCKAGRLARRGEVAGGPKNHKAGLVGPAVLLWNWFGGLFMIVDPECQNLGIPIRFP